MLNPFTHIFGLCLFPHSINYVILMLICSTLLESNPVPEICQVNSALFQDEVCLFFCHCSLKKEFNCHFPRDDFTKLVTSRFLQPLVHISVVASIPRYRPFAFHLRKLFEDGTRQASYYYSRSETCAFTSVLKRTHLP